ncbi:putative ArsR family transcriptional regulator [Deinobacterium chartae]|uniref:Putative ArsR family transcriptional regulator n=1 Tax=Deinobacterium chartae TaxID=521158 RepID=A0A841HYA0_9DEIO|nr:transcriptional regulator [Deinobacterium chartae]MBB6096765.1 putative ArsR family transcriptional regulator [Deinobacterium chartae]
MATATLPARGARTAAPTRKPAEEKILEVLPTRSEWNEVDLAKTVGLTPTHVRNALGSLLEQGLVRQISVYGDSKTYYGMASSGLEPVEAGPLTREAERVLTHLQDRPDTISNIAHTLRLSRAQVESALALLEANDLIACSFVGMLVVFRTRDWTSHDLKI